MSTRLRSLSQTAAALALAMSGLAAAADSQPPPQPKPNEQQQPAKSNEKNAQDGKQAVDPKQQQPCAVQGKQKRKRAKGPCAVGG